MADPVRAGLEVLSPDAMGRADAAAARLIPLATLMENAGRAVARATARRFGPSRTLVLCGPGNNGGDGFVAARLLAAQGWPVSVGTWKAVRPGTAADAAARRWRGAVAPAGSVEPERADLVIDALFGAGLRHPLDDELSGLLERARRVLAVDLPSGVDGATGALRGRVRAAEATVTFVRPKPGHLLEPGRTLCGALTVADIGMPDAALAAAAAGEPPIRRNEPGLFRLRDAGPDDHKYTRGVVSVCGGAAMGGAARLAADAARRAGAGLVRLAATTPGLAASFRVGAAGLIVDEGPLDAMVADERRSVWVCGPGLSVDEADAALGTLLRPGIQLVADGGALTACAGRPERLRGAAVLTPHEGEFRSLFGPRGVDAIASVREAATRTGAVVLLKGATTVIGAPDGRVALNTHATPALATAGSGDTLAGVIGAMLANGLAPFEAACAGVWLHGEAGITAGRGLIAEDLAAHLPAAIAAARSSAAV